MKTYISKLHSDIQLRLASLNPILRGLGEKGQAMSEYIILLVLIALGLSFMMKGLPTAISDYMQAIYFCVSRPVP